MNTPQEYVSKFHSVDTAWKYWNEEHPDEETSRSTFRRLFTPHEPVDMGRVHIVIGDTQAKPGVPLDHMRWIGYYIRDHFMEKFAPEDVSLIHLGDHHDMPSLSSYDKGKKSMEGRRVKKDIEVGNHAWDLLNEPIKGWPCGKDLLLGNHEYRIIRACEDDAQLDGLLSIDDLNATDWGWTVHPFLKPFELDGVTYCHYFYNPMTGKPYGGELRNRLKTIGRSFTMGHQQGLDHVMRPVGNRIHHALVNGSCYLHDEDYLGFQGNSYWRGIVVCHQVENGMYDPMMVSLDYLCRRYEHKTLSEFLKKP